MVLYGLFYDISGIMNFGFPTAHSFQGSMFEINANFCVYVVQVEEIKILSKFRFSLCLKIPNSYLLWNNWFIEVLVTKCFSTKMQENVIFKAWLLNYSTLAKENLAQNFELIFAESIWRPNLIKRQNINKNYLDIFWFTHDKRS